MDMNLLIHSVFSALKIMKKLLLWMALSKKYDRINLNRQFCEF